MSIFSTNVESQKKQNIIITKLKSNNIRAIYSTNIVYSGDTVLIIPIDGCNTKILSLNDKYEHMDENMIELVYKSKYNRTVDLELMPIKKEQYTIMIVKNLEQIENIREKFNAVDIIHSMYPKSEFIVIKVIKVNNFDDTASTVSFSSNSVKSKNTDEMKIIICYEYTPYSGKTKIPTFKLYNEDKDKKENNYHIFVANGEFSNKMKKTDILINKKELLSKFELFNDFLYNNRDTDELQTMTIRHLDKNTNYANIDFELDFTKINGMGGLANSSNCLNSFTNFEEMINNEIEKYTKSNKENSDDILETKSFLEENWYFIILFILLGIVLYKLCINNNQ